jgi:hypothetical protein
MNYLPLMLLLSIPGQAATDPAFTCTVSKRVVSQGESVEAKTWAPPIDWGHQWTYHWSATAGELNEHGSTAIWDFTDAASGRATVHISARSDGGVQKDCAASVFIEGSVASRGDRFSRRFLLVRGQSEPSGYGLYSYVVLTPAGDDQDAKDRNRRLLEIWKNTVVQLTALERKEPKTALNGIFVPVDLPNDRDPDVDWLLKHYDYARADHLLLNVKGEHKPGPYLISSKLPLTKEARQKQLVLGAWWAPSSTIEFWFAAFVDQGQQEQFDQTSAFDMFNLKMRTIVGEITKDFPRSKEAVTILLQEK